MIEMIIDFILSIIIYFFTYTFLLFYYIKKININFFFKKPITIIALIVLLILFIRFILLLYGFWPFYEQELLRIIYYPIYKLLPKNFNPFYSKSLSALSAIVVHIFLTLFFIYHLIIQLFFLKFFEFKILKAIFVSTFFSYIISSLSLIIIHKLLTICCFAL